MAAIMVPASFMAATMRQCERATDAWLDTARRQLQRKANFAVLTREEAYILRCVAATQRMRATQ